MADSTTTFQNRDVGTTIADPEPVSMVNVWPIIKRAQMAFKSHPDFNARKGFRFASMLYATIHALDVPISDWLSSLPIDKTAAELVFWLRENGH